MNITPRFRRWLIILAALLAVFSIGGFLIAPPIVRAQLEKRLSAELGRRVTVEKVKLNPYALSLTLENFAIQEKDGARRFLGWDRLYVNFDALSSLWGEWVLDEISLQGFKAQVALNADQSFNFSDILARVAPPAATPSPPKAPTAASRPIRIVRLNVGGAAVGFTDASRKTPFASTLGPLTFSLTEFRTVSQRGAPYQFAAVTEAGEKLSWTGTLRADPVSSAGELRVENLLLAKYAPYYADQVQADVVGGTLSIRGRYELNLAEGKHVMQLTDGAVQIRDLKVLERSTKEPVLALPSFDVTGVEADALTLRARIKSVALTGGNVRVRREKDGTINLLAMLRPPGQPVAGSGAAGAQTKTPLPAAAAGTPPSASPAVATAPAAAAPVATAKPDVLVGEISAKGLGVDVTDLSAPRPAQLALSDIALSLKNATLADGAKMPLHAGFSWAPKGTVQIDGEVSILPLKADLKVNVAGLELLPLSPYAEQFADARLTQGALTVALDVHAALPDNQSPDATVAGNVQVERFGLVDGAHNEDLAGFGALSLRGIRASTSPELSVALEEVNLTGPFVRVIMGADKMLNLASVMRVPPPSKDSAAPAQTQLTVAPAAPASVASASAPPKPALPKIEIGKIVIHGGDYRFTDRSVEPNVGMTVGDFGGEITGLSSTAPGKGELKLSALVDGAGPIAIAGRVDPLAPKPFVDLKVDFKNVDLVPLSPYSGKYAGYELARGKLILDVKVLVDGKKIDAANVLTLHQFTFGQEVKSPDATGLPVRLGVALLKDLDGNIVIDLPVQGELGDPNFKIGRVVLRVITNLLTKAATSPFTLLGAAFGGGGDELAFQEFAPGSTEIQATEAKKLETMVKALGNRPGLSVALEGGYDAAADAYALRRVKLAEQVRRAIWEKKHQADPNIAPPAELSITAEERVAMIKTLFDQKFPPGTQFGTPVPPPPRVVAPPPPPAAWWQRVMATVTFKAQRDKRVAARLNAEHNAEHAKAVEAAIAAGLPLAEMEGRLAETVTIDDNDLRALAQARARQVRDYFTQTGKIAAERVFLTQDKAGAPPPAAAGKGPRVFLTLQ